MVGGLPRVTGPTGESREGFFQFRRAVLGSGLGVSGRGQEEEGLLLHPCPITLIICPMYCSLLILNSRYQIALPQSPVYLRRKLD